MTNPLTAIKAYGEQLSNKADHILSTTETLPGPGVVAQANIGSLSQVTGHFLNRPGYVSNSNVQGTGKTRFSDLVYDLLAKGPQSEQFGSVCIHEVENITTRSCHIRFLDELASYVDLIVSDQHPYPTDRVRVLVENVASQLKDQSITGIEKINQLEDAIRTARTFGQLLAVLQSVDDPGDSEPVFPLFLFEMPVVNMGIDELWETLPSRSVAVNRTFDRFEFDKTEDLIGGAIGGVVVSATAFLLSRSTTDTIGRSLLAILLVLAGGAYFGFAWEVSPRWLFVELAQTLVLGTVALMGLYGSPYWLAAGWAAHPFWDVGLHLIGPGQSFVPATYPVACVSFDLLVAAYIVVVYQAGLLDAYSD